MNDLRIFDCEQGSPEWLKARAGVPSASVFATVIAKGRGGGPSETRAKLLRQLAAEVITGEPQPTWAGNQHTERGKAMEAQVRDLYESSSDLPVSEVGFMMRGRVGCSPDALVGDDGLLEIKTALAEKQIERLEAGVLPPEYKAQVMGQLYVSGRQFCDFISYWPALPQLRVRVYRDLDYLSNMKAELDRFVIELDALVSKIRAMS